MKTNAKPMPFPWLAVLAAILLPLLGQATTRAADLGVGTYIERFELINETTYRWTLFGASYNLRYTGFGTAQGPWQIEPISGRDVIQLQVWNTLRSANGTGDYRRSADVFPVGPTDYVLVARKVVPTPFVPPPEAMPDMTSFVQEEIQFEGYGVEGLTYHASGLPRGVTCDASTGEIYGFPERVGTYAVRRWAQRGKVKSEVMSSTLTVTPLPPSFTGRYETLLRTSGGEPFAHFSCDVSANGTYSARLLRPGLPALPIKSRLGFMRLEIDLRNKPIPPKLHGLDYFESSDLYLAFRYDESGTFRVETDEQASDGSVHSLYNYGVKLAAFSAAQPAPWGKRNYTLALRSENAPASAPAGVGAVSVSAAVTGVLTFKGKTADGATITGAFSPTSDASFRPFLLPAGQSGAYLAGDLKLRASSGSYYAGASDANLSWRKPALANTAYPSGFGPLRVVPRLAPWVKPSASGLAASLGLGAPSSLDLVVTAPGISNLASNPLALPAGLILDSKGRLVGEGADASRVSAKLDLSTGLLTGYVLGGTPENPTAPRKHPFQAVLFQPPAPNTPTTLAEGFALLPSTPSASVRSVDFRALYVP